MQGRTGKSPKKEIVIESPQQYKGSAEAEVDAVPQVLVKPKVIEPLDYENVLVQRKTQILSDVMRDMLQFPLEDFEGGTLYPTVPENAEREAQSLFVQECIKTYKTDWHVVNYKYEDYSGDFRQLPNKVSRPDKLPVHVFEVDEDVDKDEDTASLGSQKDGISKHGWLCKGNMNSAISVTMRSFKRRYFHPHSARRWLLQFELLQGRENFQRAQRNHFPGLLYGCYSEQQSSEPCREKRNGEIHDGAKESHFSRDISCQLENCLSSLQSTRDIESRMRNETRLKLFTLDPDTQKLDFSGIEPDVKQFEEKFGKRVLVNCNDLSFNLQSCVAENEEGPTTNVRLMVEPFYVTLSLFDIQNGRKISSDFHVDLNHPSVRGMMPSNNIQYMNGGGDAHPEGRLVYGVPETAMQYPRQGVFSVTCPHPDIFLVARIEKVLQGGINHCAEPYMKSSDSTKAAQKVLKNAKLGV
ncbi:unnamed protein product [Lampetra planeri]